jgi:hypothetical protein
LSAKSCVTSRSVVPAVSEMSSVLLWRGHKHPVWLAGSGEGQPLRGDRLANPALDGLDRDKRNVIVPEHRAVAAGANQRVFDHPRARAQRGNGGIAEINLSHAQRLTYGAVRRNAHLGRGQWKAV